MRTKKISNNELSDILKVSLRKLKGLSHDEIKKCLFDVGYNYYGKDEKGKHKVVLYDKTKKEFFNMCKQEFKTDKTNEFKTYFIKRTEKNEVLSRKDIADCSNTTIYMIDKWDRIMLDKDIIEENGIKYFIENISTNEQTEITKEVYLNHFINDNVVKIKDMFRTNIIDELEFENLLKEEAFNIKKTDGNLIYLKTSKYKINKDNDLYKRIIKLIGVE